ncbi:DUF6980 family protein [Gottfriedia luciferensis]|uniref:DUF6980 family protein n=1 Tax=Gottfriedia luciferensis TaxID=178774 RepID=UPI001ABF3B27|nr:hypothetical protein [Gottfriedia luciferensis]
MDCKKYRDNYKRYNKFPLDQSVWDTEEYKQYQEHYYDCELCGIWDMEQKAIEKGMDVNKYCCTEMAYHLSKGLDKDPYENPDVVIIHNKKFDEYGIPIQDGGNSFIMIKHCPWCGNKLPQSKRDMWWETLESLGLNNPFEQNIPEKFETDEWYR